MEKLLFVLLFVCNTAFAQNEATVTMKEYVDMQIQLNREWSQRLADIRYENINENVVRADAAMEKRLDGMNEFRDTLKDQSATFMTRGELFAWIIALVGLFFGFTRYLKDKQDSNTTKSIMSGDKVEVKK